MLAAATMVAVGQQIQLVVGASRRRAAPRSQFSGAALVATSHFIG